MRLLAAPLADSPLCAAALHLDRPAVIARGRIWTWRHVHLAANALAKQLDAGMVCNLCESRIGFLVTWLAALKKRCVQLLPPSSGRAELDALLRMADKPVVVVDDGLAFRPEWASHARCAVWNTVSIVCVDDAPLSWSPDWDSELVCLYTSGSTGQPEPQKKTLAQLARGAQLLGARLGEVLEGGLSTVDALLCSVPPQHMFGLEASVMLPLIHGVAVVEGRPLLPADVQAAFHEVGHTAAWITTPLHLLSLKRANESLPNCGIVIASTMPLDATLAIESETLAAAPVLEIYGSTETGAIATRRTSREKRWKPLPDVRLAASDDGCQVSGSHFRSPKHLADLVAIDEAGTFELVGRKADLIKVAGRRASLAGLNQILQQLPGLEDGVFYLPASGSSTQRLVLIHAGAFDRIAAEAWLRERIDPVFLPRTFIGVERLPRSPSGKLARAGLDEIYERWRAESSRDRPR